jgi:3-methyladenine DNA glycosylase AlkD
LEEVQKLLMSPFHEKRLFLLLMLVRKFAKGNEADRSTIYKMCMKNTPYINSWDLVDSSAPRIVGAYLEERERERRVLYRLSQSASLWERRIAIISTFHFIRNHQFNDALVLCQRFSFKIRKI